MAFRNDEDVWEYQSRFGLAQMDFHNLQGGRIGELDASGGYEYIYIEPLRSIWEPACAGKCGRPGSPTFYPPELAYST